MHWVVESPQTLFCTMYLPPWMGVDPYWLQIWVSACAVGKLSRPSIDPLRGRAAIGRRDAPRRVSGSGRVRARSRRSAAGPSAAGKICATHWSTRRVGGLRAPHSYDEVLRQVAAVY